MTAPFWLGALALVALVWTALWASQRRAAATAPRPGRANIRLLDEALEALHADHQRGAIDADQWALGRAEIERRMLDEDAGAGIAPPGVPNQSPRRTFAALAVALPAIAIGGYLWLGDPGALNPPATAATEPAVSSADVRAMVDTLAARMRDRPPGQADDLTGWVMLARSLAALQRFDEAATAFQRAIALAPNDASLLADLADVLMAQPHPGGAPRQKEEADRLVARALALDPGNVKALALAGNAAFERHDSPAAIALWRRARALSPAGSDFANGLDQNLAEAGAPRETATAAASVQGVVRIAGTLAARVAPGDTVFIVARAADGPPMPLAVLRRTAAELPIAFTLDDSTAMSPDRLLSQAGRLIVSARVSRSGEAMPRAGDLVGQVEAVTGDTALSITLDRVQP